MLGRAAAWVGERVFPATCLGCDRYGSWLCATCRPALPYLPPEVCARCAGWRSSRTRCSGCAGLSPAVRRIIAALAYDGAARAAVIRLKFRSGRCLVPLMGDLLREALAVRPVAADLIVPVPLSSGRLRWRGFNQSALLAGEIAATIGAPIAADVLTRRDRPAQSGLALAARRANLAGAIVAGDAAREWVVGRRVLLVDDVVTTGATVSACAEALRRAGASSVVALAFARDL